MITYYEAAVKQVIFTDEIKKIKNKMTVFSFRNKFKLAVCGDGARNLEHHRHYHRESVSSDYICAKGLCENDYTLPLLHNPLSPNMLLTKTIQHPSQNKNPLKKKLHS
jgi:hypothetical protein